MARLAHTLRGLYRRVSAGVRPPRREAAAADPVGEFLAVAAHELRGPIAVVHGLATTLCERHDELDGDRRRALRAGLCEHTGRLLELADQLLDLSRAEAGGLHVERRPFRPREAVDALLARVVPEGRGKVEVAIDPAREVVSDRSAFELVVANLVANAVAYGRPPVRVSGSDGNGSFRLAVEDRGPGIEPGFVPKLFDRFTRSGSARPARPGGAGLGLAIARRYAEALGGELRYERAEPRGARFVLSFPAA